MKFFYSFLALAVIVLVAGLSESAPTSPYDVCTDKSALCFGLGGSTNENTSCISDHSCTFFFRSTYEAAKGFNFALVAPALPADQYVAVAFSNETGMAGLVVQCFHDSNSKNTIEYSFNAGYHNEKISDQKTITGFSSPVVTYENGALNCQWSTPAKSSFTYKGYEFDFAKNTYYLKLATGGINATTGSIHRHATHDGNGRLASASVVNLSTEKGIVPAKAVHHKSNTTPSPGSGSGGLYDSCKDNTALCFGLPEGCAATENCNFLFRSVYSATSGFTLSLTAPKMTASDQYIAVAFSPKPEMTGLVVACVHSSSNSIQYSYNEGTDNNAITDVSQVTGFSHLVSAYTNGQLNCQWNVPVGTKVVYKDHTFDFEKEKYYLKVATGPVTKGALEHHAHDKSGRTASQTPLSLKTTGTVHGGGTSTAKTWHASLMIFGWMGCVTTALIMARFTRDLWPEKKLFGTKYWFVAHRYLMCLGWLSMVASYIIIFVHNKGWSGTSSHSVIGVVAGVLATLQIGNSFLRPGHDSPRRVIFDYGHWFIGNSAHILALANILKVGLNRSPTFLWLLIAYLFVYMLFSDLLKKLENRVRASSYSKKTPIVLQTVVFGAILTVLGITVALIAILFKD